jgi:iron complex outermembrane receptor protein
MSLVGDVTDRLHVLAAATVMDPVVTGAGTASGLIGKRPVGTPKIHALIDLSYRTDLWNGLTFTGGAEHSSKRAASSGTYAVLGGRQLYLPSRTTFNVGARHSVTIGKLPVNIRLEVLNLFDKKSWDTIASNSFQLGETRRWNLWLITDF